MKLKRSDRCGCDGLTEDEIHEVDGEDLCDSCYDEEFTGDKDDSPNYEYSPCYECGGYGDDCSFDDNGELVDNCTDCPWNEANCNSWDN